MWRSQYSETCWGHILHLGIGMGPTHWALGPVFAASDECAYELHFYGLVFPPVGRAPDSTDDSQSGHSFTGVYMAPPS